MIISFNFIGCYSVERIRFDDEYYTELRNYAYRGIWDSNILQYVSDGNVFWIRLSVNDFTATADYYFRINLTISSKSKIDSITINSREILFDNDCFKFENDEITNAYISYSYIENLWHNSLIVSKGFTKGEYNLIRNAVKKSTIQKFIFVNMDIDYLEGNEYKNWAGTARFGIRFERTWYTPGNLWGLFGEV